MLKASLLADLTIRIPLRKKELVFNWNKFYMYVYKSIVSITKAATTHTTTGNILEAEMEATEIWTNNEEHAKEFLRILNLG